MASPYTVAPTDRGTYAHVLVANTPDKVTIQRDCDRVEVSADGTAAVYFTVDGSTPTVGGQNGYELPRTSSWVARSVSVPTGGSTVVQLVSVGTPTYSVVESQ